MVLQHLEKQFLEIVRPLTSSESLTKVSVLVSGGVDSVVLLHLFTKFKEELNVDITVLHVVFEDMEDSTEIEKFVSNICSDNLVNSAYSFANVSNKKEARDAIQDLNFSIQSDLSFTGHHLNDQIETIFLRFLRGSGEDGLRGMKSITSIEKEGVTRTLVKPFLSEDKANIIAYATNNHIPYMEDMTNKMSEYSDRNFVRNEVLPLISERFNLKNILNFTAGKDYEPPNDIDLYSGKYATKDLIRLSPASRVFVIRECLRKKHGFIINKSVYLTLKHLLEGNLKGFKAQINSKIDVVCNSEFVEIVAK